VTTPPDPDAIFAGLAAADAAVIGFQLDMEQDADQAAARAAIAEVTAPELEADIG
jgi:hypothetical protein